MASIGDPPAEPPAAGPRRWLRRAWRVVRLPLAAYLVVVLVMMFLEERMIFVPSKFPAGDWRPWGLVFEDAHFQAADGTRLHGWYVPCPGAATRSSSCTATPAISPIAPRCCGSSTTALACRC